MALTGDWMKVGMIVLSMLFGGGAKIASLDALFRIRHLDGVERVMSRVEAEALRLALAARAAGPSTNGAEQAERLLRRLEAVDAATFARTFAGNPAVIAPVRQLDNPAMAAQIDALAAALAAGPPAQAVLDRVDRVAFLAASAADSVNAAASVEVERLWIRVLVLGGAAVALFVITSLGGTTWATLAQLRIGGFLTRIEEYTRRLRQADADKARAVEEAELAAIARTEAKTAATLDKLNEALALAEAGASAAEHAAASAEGSLEATRRMINTLSEQLKTPLDGIRDLAATLTLGSVITERERQRIDKLESSGDQLQHLATAMLDLVRLDQGVELPESRPFRPEIVGEAAIAELRPLALRRGIGLRCEYAEDSAEFYLGDPRRVVSMLVALLREAIEATPRGEVLVRLDDAPDGLRLTVRDGGPTPKDPAAVFAPNAIAEHAGRAVAREIAHRLGGRIWAEAAPPRGMALCVSLPYGAPSALADHDTRDSTVTRRG